MGPPAGCDIPSHLKLSQPEYPDLPGAEEFAGTAFHTARWDSANWVLPSPANASRR